MRIQGIEYEELAQEFGTPLYVYDGDVLYDTITGLRKALHPKLEIFYSLKANPNVIIICHADSYEEAADLYQLGAMYVMLPHMIGSERIGSFIKRAGLHRKEFIQYRERHLLLLERRQRENESATG